MKCPIYLSFHFVNLLFDLTTQRKHWSKKAYIFSMGPATGELETFYPLFPYISYSLSLSDTYTSLSLPATFIKFSFVWKTNRSRLFSLYRSMSWDGSHLAAPPTSTSPTFIPLPVGRPAWASTTTDVVGKFVRKEIKFSCTVPFLCYGPSSFLK